MQITSVLSKLSDPMLSEENKAKYDGEFQKLLSKKRELENK
jgi:hypothetical protein